MPDMTPVANQIIPPDPTKGINTFSGILGIKQRQQQLQLGEQSIQTGQADVQQAQRTMNARLFMQGMLQSGKDDQGNNIFDDKGEPDPDRVIPAINRNVPSDLAQPIVQNILKTQGDKAELANTVRGLSQNYKNDLSGIVRSLPLTTTSKDATAAIDNYVKDNPGAAAAGYWAKNLIADHWDNLPPDQRAKHQLALAQQFQPAASTATQQQPSMLPVQTKGGIAQVQQNPLAIGGMGAMGGATPNTLPPTVVSPPGGVPAVIGGAGGGGGGGGGRNISGFPGVQPTDQDIKNFGDYQSNLNQRVNIASDSIPRIQMAENALDAIRGGAGAQTYAKWAQRLQAMGMSPALVDAVANGNLAKAQEAEKLLFQTTFSGLRQSMQGDPARVAEFQSAEKVFPSIGTDPRATKEILGFMVDQGQRDYAEQQSLNKARKEGTFNPVTWQGDYQQKLRAGQVPGVPSSQVPGAGAKTILRTGTYKGRKVAEYSDGTHGYVD